MVKILRSCRQGLGRHGFAVAVMVAATGRATILAQVPVPAQLLAYPDLVLHNGQVLTVDPLFTVAQAIAVRDGKVLAEGGNGEIQALAGPSAAILQVTSMK